MIKTIFHLFIISFTFIVSAEDTTKDNPIDALVQLLNSNNEKYFPNKSLHMPAIALLPMPADTKPENIIKQVLQYHRNPRMIISVPVSASTKPENLLKEAMRSINTLKIIEIKNVNVKKLYDQEIENSSISLIEADKDTILLFFTVKSGRWWINSRIPADVMRVTRFNDSLRTAYMNDSLTIEKVTALANSAPLKTSLTIKNNGVINYSWKVSTAQKFHYKDSLYPTLKPGETYTTYPSKGSSADVYFFIPTLFQITNNSEFVFRYCLYYHYDDVVNIAGSISLLGKIKNDVLRIKHYTISADSTKTIPQDQNDCIGYVKNDSLIILNFYRVDLSARDTCRPYQEKEKVFLVNGRVSNDSLKNLIKMSSAEMGVTDTIKYPYRYRDYNVTKYQIVF
jgi:hypothetical protein